MKRIALVVAFAFVVAIASGCRSEHRSQSITGPSDSMPTQVAPVKTVTISISKVSGNTYQVIVNGPDLPNTFPQIPVNTWDGSLLWLHEWTKNSNYVIDVPFVVGKSDHFTFAYVNSTGTVDFSIRLQPKGTLTRIPVILNEKVKLPAGFKIVWDEQASEARVQGPLPS